MPYPVLRQTASTNKTNHAWTATAGTVMGWFRMVNDRAAASAFLTVGVGTTAGNANCSLETTADGHSIGLWNNASTVDSGLDIVRGRWTHLAMTFAAINSAGALLGYVDGRLAVTNATIGSGIAGTPTVFEVANDQDAEWLDGQFFSVKAYTRVLSEDEIRREMMMAAPGSRAGLSVYWPGDGRPSVTQDLASATAWQATGSLRVEPAPSLPPFSPARSRGRAVVPFVAGGPTNYQVDFSLAAAASMGIAGAAIAAAGLSAPATAGLTQSGAAAAGGSVGYAAASALAQSAKATAGAALNQSATAGLSQSGAAGAAGAIGLSATAGAGYVGGAASAGGVSLPATAGLAQSAKATAAASLGFAPLSSIGFTTGQAIVVDFSLAATAGLSLSGAGAGAGSVGLAATAGLAQSAAAQAAGALPLTATAALALSAASAANVAFSLPTVGGLTFSETDGGGGGGGATVTGYLALETALGVLILRIG